jgi:hypothetical protein
MHEQLRAADPEIHERKRMTFNRDLANFADLEQWLNENRVTEIE